MSGGRKRKNVSGDLAYLEDDAEMDDDELKKLAISRGLDNKKPFNRTLFASSNSLLAGHKRSNRKN